MVFGLDFFTQNWILLVPLIGDLLMGILIARNILHPYIGRFDVALILDPIGDVRQAAKKTVVSLEGRLYMVVGRKEWPVLADAFRVGKGTSAFTYKRDNDQVSFVQFTHRVFFYTKGSAYPIKAFFGKPGRSTTSTGMDLFIAQKLWQQAVSATQKANINLPILVIIVCILAGVGLGYILGNLEPIHQAVYGAGSTSTSTGVTGTLTNSSTFTTVTVTQTNG